MTSYAQSVEIRMSMTKCLLLGAMLLGLVSSFVACANIARGVVRVPRSYPGRGVHRHVTGAQDRDYWRGEASAERRRRSLADDGASHPGTGGCHSGRDGGPPSWSAGHWREAMQVPCETLCGCPRIPHTRGAVGDHPVAEIGLPASNDDPHEAGGRHSSTIRVGDSCLAPRGGPHRDAADKRRYTYCTAGRGALVDRSASL
jgi:hypothetical protein